jgi:hypothetical protein
MWWREGRILMSWAIRKGECMGPGVMVPTCNPSYSGGKDRRISVQAQPGKSYRYLISKQKQNKNWVWRCMPVISATQEVESNASPGKSMRLYLKLKLGTSSSDRKFA